MMRKFILLAITKWSYILSTEWSNKLNINNEINAMTLQQAYFMARRRCE